MRSIIVPVTAVFLVLLFLSVLIVRNVKRDPVRHRKISKFHTEEINFMKDRIQKSDEEWRKELTDEQYRILRKKGTERPFTGKYNDFKKEGIFVCAACGNELFSSETKYNSGSGWPSFYAPITKENVETEQDNSFMMNRTEVLCSRCGGHLGHVFPDGPAPTHQRYCINSAALEFETGEKVEMKSGEKE